MTEMSPEFAVVLMMNNYFHDVATALLAASGVVLGIIVVRYEAAVDESRLSFLSSLYSGMVSLARFTLLWILLAAIPRTLYFTRFELKNAIDHNQVPALIIKHLLSLAFVAIGAWLWCRYSKRVAGILSSGP